MSAMPCGQGGRTATSNARSRPRRPRQYVSFSRDGRRGGVPMSDSSEPRYKIEVGGRSYGKYTVTLLAGDEIVDRDKVDLDNEEKREGLIAKWAKKHAGLCPDGLREVLLKKL